MLTLLQVLVVWTALSVLVTGLLAVLFTGARRWEAAARAASALREVPAPVVPALPQQARGTADALAGVAG